MVTIPFILLILFSPSYSSHSIIPHTSGRSERCLAALPRNAYHRNPPCRTLGDIVDDTEIGETASDSYPVEPKSFGPTFLRSQPQSPDLALFDMGEPLAYKGSLTGHTGWVTAIATSSENPDMILTASRGEAFATHSEVS